MEVSALRHPAGLAVRGPTPLLRLQSDERLVALTRRGNQAAFEALVARYQSRLLAFCRHMLGSREDAEDVLQEVFVNAHAANLAWDTPSLLEDLLGSDLLLRDGAISSELEKRLQALGIDIEHARKCFAEFCRGEHRCK